MVRLIGFIFASVWIGTLAMAQGFAGLGTDAEGFAVPERYTGLTFPEDHGAHPQFRIEWWYLTATLDGADGQDYGIQWTLFRSALAPQDQAEGWSAPQLWMGHAGLTTPAQHFSAERFGRGGIGQAGVTTTPFRAFIDDWELRTTVEGNADPFSRMTAAARGQNFSYALTLEADGPLIFHGDGGYSVKSAQGQASYYYSQPFYQVTGTLSLPDGPVAVTGTAWLDREWSSQPLSETQEGWDWFSLQFPSGERLMGFGLRDLDGSVFTAATWIETDGTTTAYPDGALRLSPVGVTDVQGRQVPTEWRLQLPDRNLDITTRPLNAQAWMDTSVGYWEGPIRFDGSHEGRGYLEMTGYE